MTVKKTAKKHDFILSKAKQVFIRKGFASVTMTDIIEECGISRGGIYLYFSSVDEIFLQVLLMHNKQKEKDEKINYATPKKFVQLMDEYFDKQKKRLLNMDNNSFLMAMHEYRFVHRNDQNKDFFHTQFLETKEPILEMLHCGVEQGYILAHNVEDLAVCIMFFIEGISTMAVSTGVSETTIDSQTRFMKDMILNSGNVQTRRQAYMPKIIITSGGTREKIDDVRSISNISTGKLGSAIANAFYNSIPDIEIIYICSESAIVPEIPCKEIIKVNSVNDLSKALKSLLTREKIDAVIHAMAVSDYAVSGVVTAESIAKCISHKVKSLDMGDATTLETLEDTILKSIVTNGNHFDNASKLPSSLSNLMLSMKKTPKIINMIKELQPETILVGFKLLNRVDEQELIETGHKLLLKNKCDFVLANDLCSINQESHTGYLITPDAKYSKFDTKQNIATGIVDHVSKKMNKKKENVENE